HTQAPGGAGSEANVARRPDSCRKAACRAAGTPHSPRPRTPAPPPPARSRAAHRLGLEQPSLVRERPVGPEDLGGDGAAPTQDIRGWPLHPALPPPPVGMGRCHRCGGLSPPPRAPGGGGPPVAW